MFLLSLLLTLNLSCTTSPTPQNIKLDLVVPDGPVYAGEIVFLEARLTNISAVPINISIHHNDAFAWNLDIRVYESDKEYSVCVMHIDRSGCDILLKPGEIHVYRKPLYLCTKRDFDEDKRYRAKAIYWSMDGNPHSLLESQEKSFDVLAPKRDEDKEAYKMLYPLAGAMPGAYSFITAYKLVPEKYPSSLYAKYALFQEGKQPCTEHFSENQSKSQSVIEAIQKGKASLERLLREYPAFHLTDETLYYLALAHQKLGEKEKALELYNKVVKELPGTEGAEMAANALQSLNSAK